MACFTQGEKNDMVECIYGIQYTVSEGATLSEKDEVIVQRALSLYAQYLNMFGINTVEDRKIYEEVFRRS